LIPSTTRTPKRRAWTAGLLALVVLGPAPLLARGESPPPGTESSTESAEPGAAVAIHPDAVSTFQVRVYRIREKKLWKGFLEVLQEAGYPPEEVDEKNMRVKTSFVDFDAKDYSEAVADAAPRFTPSYHIIQMNQVKQGKVSIEGVVSRDETGAALSVRARLLVEGLEFTKRIRMLADRRSSGVIEEDFLRKLEDTLRLERVK
jgi:hypothetical protein